MTRMNATEMSHEAFSHTLLHSILNSTTDMIWSVDRNYGLVIYNTRLDEHFRKNYGTRARPGRGGSRAVRRRASGARSR